MNADIKSFDIDIINKTLTTEASDLGPAFSLTNLTIVNNESEGQAMFFLTETIIDGDGDVTHWKFSPTGKTLESAPQLAGWSVTVFND